VLFVNTADTAGSAREALVGRNFELVPALRPDGAIAGVISLAKLRQAPPESRLVDLVQPAATILADVPLTRAVVMMNDAKARQLVVIDEATGSKLVGILSISDLVRAHARVASTGAHTRVTTLAGLAVLRAGELAREAPVIEGAATMQELLLLLGSSPSGAVVVHVKDRAAGVVLLEHVREFLTDEGLQQMLLAADLARPLPVVSAEATLVELVAACAPEDVPAVLISGATEGEPARLVTRPSLGAVLLDWYASEARA
jgi:CBS domain-containing protein